MIQGGRGKGLTPLFIVMMVTLFLFVKGTATADIGDLLAQAQVAAALDTLERLEQVPAVNTMVVATSNRALAERASSLGAQAELDPPNEEFHFGRRLASVVEKYKASIPLYVGGGSGVLMQVEDWRHLVGMALEQPHSVIANNYYSCDFAAWSPGEAVQQIPPPALDNDLAYRLGERAGLTVVRLEKNAATQLDIDTPTDLLSLAFARGVGKHLRTQLDRARLDVRRVERLRELVRRPSAVLLIAGRVSASMALYLERSTPCQWRILSEERGMRASGREERGEVRSLFGDYLDRAGIANFFGTLARMADGAIIDTRVLFAHRGLRPSMSDRFYSDLFEPDRIADPFIRELTAAARSARIPILFGGHSAVSGGMYALAEG